MDVEDRQELIGRLFTLMTAWLEDAAALAAEGQGTSKGDEERRKLAVAIHAGAEHVSIVSDAAAALLSLPPQSQQPDAS